jgi:hypothetical protein
VTIPVLVTPPTAELAVPYVTPAMFSAYPTWLDLDNLLPGGASSIQEDVLADVLLAASDWAIGECRNMPLHAHWVQGEQLRTRAGASGRLYVHPRDVPVRAVTALSYGWDPSSLAALALPDSSMWIEDGREVSFVPGGALNFTGPAIQFGAAPRAGMVTYVQWSYVAGFPSTTLDAAAVSGASSVTVTDPAGILPGDVLRIYDPGDTTPGAAASEALTVASTYTPAMPTIPATATSIPLAAETAFAHAAGTGITGMPRKVLQAVIAYAVALLMREDVSAEEPESPFGPAARTTAGERGGKAAGLVNDARKWLAPYAPVLRS